MSAPFVSICVPVYNMAPYLRACIESVREQSFTDWELVCTDDGSTDGSGAILDECAAADSRIKVIHQANAGVSRARNAALDRAEGDWLWFVDPDDMLLPGALERIRALIRLSGCDALYFSEFTVFREKCTARAADDVATFILKMDVPDRGANLLFQKKPLQGQPFMRILRRSLFQAVRYPDGVVYLEDSINMVDILSVKAKWAYVDESVYGYRWRPGSVSHGWRKGKFPLVVRAYQEIFSNARRNLGLTDAETRAFIGQANGAIRYYLGLAFDAEDAEGLKDLVSSYDAFRANVGLGFPNAFTAVRCMLARRGVYRLFSRPVGLCEHLYFGVKARLRRIGHHVLPSERRDRIKRLFLRFIRHRPGYCRKVTTRGVTDVPRSPRVIVSLTSYPRRIRTVHRTVETLLTQTFKPDMVILWLGEDRFPNRERDLPENLLRLREFGLTIGWCKDIRSYTKLIPALKAYPEDVIVTVDDDMFYFPEWLERLHASYLKNKDVIHCHRVGEIKVEKGMIRPYREWPAGRNRGLASYGDLLMGVAGVLYPPHALAAEVMREEVFLRLAPYADDLWFWAMAVLNGRRILLIDNAFQDRYGDCAADNAEALMNIDVGTQQLNDPQFRAILSAYPLVEDRLMSAKGVR